MKNVPGLVIGILAGVLFCVGALVGMQLNPTGGSAAESESIRKLDEVYALLSRYYVEDLDRDLVVEKGIEGMIGALDPHSSYIPPVIATEVQEEYAGSFGGVGLWYEVVKDTARVSSTIEGGPSEAAGVQPGDRIISVNSRNVTGDSLGLVQKLLKGPVKTSVAMTVVRRGSENITYTLIRDQVPIHTVPAAILLDDETGYIKISSFSSTTAAEFRSKLRTLEDDGATKLILDLRNNPGGILESAVAIADEFLPAGRTIVQTRSRHRAASFTEVASEGGIFENLPVIVLVNEFSASASEIIAGALQDNDRALIVGRRTFGKALVQQEFALPDGSLLHLTVSRYYTPSGRLIQTPYENGNQDDYYASKGTSGSTSDDILALPDSLRFETIGGRPVAGDGGILPDVVLFGSAESETPWSNSMQLMLASSLDVLFAREWFDQREASLREQFGNMSLADFDRQFSFDREFWLVLAQRADSYPSLSGLEPVDLSSSNQSLYLLFKARIAQQLFGTAGWYYFFTRIDPVIVESRNFWQNAAELAQIN